MKLSRKKWDETRDCLGEGFHAGLRKAAQSKASGTAWRAIHRMPDAEWTAVVDFVMFACFGPRPTRGKE